MVVMPSIIRFDVCLRCTSAGEFYPRYLYLHFSGT